MSAIVLRAPNQPVCKEARPTPECWVITLDPQKAEVRALCAQLEEAGVTPRFFAAVDGRHGMPTLLPGERIDQRAALRFRCAPLGTAEVGCYLSHYRLIRELYESGAQAACILEDDVALEPGFRATLDATLELDSSHEMVRLMSLRLRPRRICGNLAGNVRLVRPSDGLLGCQGYVVNRKGMEKILRQGPVIGRPIDKFFDYFWETGLRQYGVEPHVLYEREHPTSIAKNFQKIAGPLMRLQWKWCKFISKTRRKLYLLYHWRQFLPAEFPSADIGRTKRLR